MRRLRAEATSIRRGIIAGTIEPIGRHHSARIQRHVYLTEHEHINIRYHDAQMSQVWTDSAARS